MLLRMMVPVLSLHLSIQMLDWVIEHQELIETELVIALCVVNILVNCMLDSLAWGLKVTEDQTQTSMDSRPYALTKIYRYPDLSICTSMVDLN